ncbi:S9 family peptidase [Nonomuraea jiangxiensis]|uniref:Dipeptidyl aminopeptidase/acylaminoacyl peptidase n=1 Tax=Nonomuraea jiangxiensis TaxID=633440 RepID=A0A1G8QCA6_9ACTN|nr:prolyl oligopeptidase family serine peptidase [Nonomuraea jiangxiensis]SDJ02238.1 Dipeptidyl aminopeptidase/acylaminoacyl peptidase [Nonomuraea jiangxiensis]
MLSKVTPQLVVDGALPLHPVISPDGRWVAYTVAPVGRAEDHPGSAIWIAATDQSSSPRKLTAGTAKDFIPRWAPDSTSLFFGSDRARRGTIQVYRISVEGGEAETLTTWQGGISDYLPLADGRRIALVATEPPADEGERRTAGRDDAKVWGEQAPYGRLWLLELNSGRALVVNGLGDRHVVELAQRPDGGPLAVLSWATSELDPGCSSCEVHAVDLETGRVQPLGRAALEASSPTWWNTDGNWHLCYLATTLPGPVGGRAVFDLAVPGTGAAGEHRNLTSGMTVCPSGLAEVADGPPLALFADGLDTAIYRLDPETQRFQPMCSLEGLAAWLTASQSGEVVAAVASTAYEPMNVHAGPPADRLVRLSDTRPELRGIRWGRQERLSYKAADGLDLDGLLILPVGRSRRDGPFPLITLVHGGPYDRYADRFMLGVMPSGQWLATAGYAVFLPNPRGGEGHGHEFAATVAGAVGMDEWTDIVSGIDLLIADGVADPDQVSAGAAAGKEPARMTTTGSAPSPTPRRSARRC